MLRLIQLLPLLISFSAIAATSSYNPETRLLTIPEIQIGNQIYTNGILLLGADGKYQIQAITQPTFFTLSEVDNGSTIELRLGQSLQIKVASHSDGGFQWSFDKNSTNIVDQPGYTHDFSNCSNGLVGCSGFEIFTFKSITLGTGNIFLNECRFEEFCNNPKFKVTVIVK